MLTAEVFPFVGSRSSSNDTFCPSFKLLRPARSTALSPEFAVKVSRWVFDCMSGLSPKPQAQLPYHFRRYVANAQNVPVGYFSILIRL
jgi:hypothetical protein